MCKIAIKMFMGLVPSYQDPCWVLGMCERGLGGKGLEFVLQKHLLTIS